ncbi:hypothetical protein [Marinifilum fragile]|uniref:hypothetical protein n=1 Tax=Marinifilum fragile TaxID=570161 RepID=UPI002AA7C75F|nr:hypothetical protein [Marinifilum fragile]
MKKILPIIAIVSLTFGCALPKKASETSPPEKKIQISNDAPSEKQFDVGTCSIVMKNTKIISEKKSLWLMGNVEVVHGYGSGFSEIINVGQSLKIEINKSQKEKIDTSKKLNCCISIVKEMNNTTYFKLVKIK